MLDLFEIIWLAIFSVGFVVELVGLFFENRQRGIEPLTRIVRDRIIRHRRFYGVLIFAAWVWLGFHLFSYGIGMG
jgi:hypothetical protein